MCITPPVILVRKEAERLAQLSLQMLVHLHININIEIMIVAISVHNQYHLCPRCRFVWDSNGAALGHDSVDKNFV